MGYCLPRTCPALSGGEGSTLAEVGYPSRMTNRDAGLGFEVE